jgi:hypothetical protein
MNVLSFAFVALHMPWWPALVAIWYFPDQVMALALVAIVVHLTRKATTNR